MLSPVRLRWTSFARPGLEWEPQSCCGDNLIHIDPTELSSTCECPMIDRIRVVPNNKRKKSSAGLGRSDMTGIL